MLPLAFFLLTLTRINAFTVRPIQLAPQQIPFATRQRRLSSSSFSENTEASSSSSSPIKGSLMQQQQDQDQDKKQRQQQEQQQPLSYRGARRIEKFTRLPVWPVWSGVLIWMVQRLLGDETAARLEDALTGRVCPNFFQYEETSPFVMLVHHCHSFAIWDPIRWVQRTFFPEGFPAHPHR